MVFMVLPEMKIRLDTRERGKKELASIEELFKKEDVDVQRQQLEVGDILYLAQDQKKSLLIERKNIFDLKDSVMGKDPRFFEQLINLRMNKDNYRVLYMISGDMRDLLVSVAKHGKANIAYLETSIKGLIRSIALDYQIPIFQYKDDEELVKECCKFFKMIDSPPGERPVIFKKGHKKTFQRQQDLISATEGVGIKTAKKILAEMKSPTAIGNAAQEILQEKFGKETGRKLYEIFNTPYEEKKKK